MIWKCQEKCSQKHPKSDKIKIMNLFSEVERSGTKENRFARHRQAAGYDFDRDAHSRYFTGESPCGLAV